MVGVLSQGSRGECQVRRFFPFLPPPSFFWLRCRAVLDPDFLHTAVSSPFPCLDVTLLFPSQKRAKIVDAGEPAEFRRHRGLPLSVFSQENRRFGGRDWFDHSRQGQDTAGLLQLQLKCYAVCSVQLGQCGKPATLFFALLSPGLGRFGCAEPVGDSRSSSSLSAAAVTPT